MILRSLLLLFLFSFSSNNILADIPSSYTLSPPYIFSVDISANNTTLTVTFEEAVYNTANGTGNLDVNDFH